MSVSIETSSESPIEFAAEEDDLAAYKEMEDSGDDSKISEAELATFLFNAHFSEEGGSASDNVDKALNVAKSVFSGLGDGEEGAEYGVTAVWNQIKGDNEDAPKAGEAHQMLMGRESPQGSGNMTTANNNNNNNNNHSHGDNIENKFMLQYQEGGDGELVHYGDLLTERNYAKAAGDSFKVGGNGGMRFDVAGADVPGDNGPRSELRERHQWNIMNGTHNMNAHYSNITGGDQTIMQVHMDSNGGDSIKPPVRVEYDAKEGLVMEVYTSPNQDNPKRIVLGGDPNYLKNNGFNLDLEVVNGKVTATAVTASGNVLTASQQLADGWNGYGNVAHFKAGSYNHDDDGVAKGLNMSEFNVTHGSQGGGGGGGDGAGGGNGGGNGGAGGNN